MNKRSIVQSWKQSPSIHFSNLAHFKFSSRQRTNSDLQSQRLLQFPRVTTSQAGATLTVWHKSYENREGGVAAGAGYKSASGCKSWIWNLESPSSRSMSMPPILLVVDLQVAKSGFLSPLLSPPLTETTKKVVRITISLFF